MNFATAPLFTSNVVFCVFDLASMISSHHYDAKQRRGKTKTMNDDYKFRTYVTKSAPESLQLHDVALNIFGTLLKSFDFTQKVCLSRSADPLDR